MAWYNTGTVSVTNGSTTVTGSGTNFVSGARIGEGFVGPDGRLYEIESITSATVLVLADPYLGSTQAGQDYKIVPTQSLTADLANQVTTLITDYQSVVDNAGEGKFDDGSAASPGITFVQDQDTGLFRDTANEIAISVGGAKIGEFNSGGLDGTVIGGSTPAAGSFTTGSFTGDVTFGDNDKAIFGAGSDLQIYHDGSGSYITEGGTGDLYIQASNLILEDPDGNNYFAGVDGGATLMYYNGVSKLATTSTGVDITGTVTSDGLTVDLPNATDVNIDGTDGGGIQFKNSGADEFRLDSASNDGALYHTPSGKNHTFRTDGANRLKITTGGDIQFYENTGTTPKLTWDSAAESLGIGTTSINPSVTLQVQGNIAAASSSVYADSYKNWGTNLILDSESSLPMLFKIDGTERMRLDSNGILLVGTTTIDPGFSNTNVGASLANAGYVIASRANDVSGHFNRNSDGNIIAFAKDGSPVGSIGVYNTGNRVFIGTGDTGVVFGHDVGTGDAIFPMNPSTNTTRDDGISLGVSTSRFKNLVLSGGVYLGGTGSANLLDDYEEGTWVIGTNGDATGSLGANAYGLYVKIGQLVYIQGVFQVITNFTSNSIDGLPFVPINDSVLDSSLHGQGNLRYGNNNGAITLSSSSDTLAFSDSTGANVAPTTSNDPFRFSATYRTTS